MVLTHIQAYTLLNIGLKIFDSCYPTLPYMYTSLIFPIYVRFTHHSKSLFYLMSSWVKGLSYLMWENLPAYTLNWDSDACNSVIHHPKT